MTEDTVNTVNTKNTYDVQVSLFLTRILGGKTYFLLNRRENKDLPKVDLTYGGKLEVNLQKILEYLGKEVQIEKSGFLKLVNNYSGDSHSLEIGMIAKLKKGEPKADWIWHRSDRLPENLSMNAKSSIMSYMNKNSFYEF